MKENYEELRLEVEELGKYVASKQKALKILIRLLRRGISEQDVTNVLDIIEQHIDHLTILELTKQIDTYGNVNRAKFQLLMEKTKLESENEMLERLNHMIRVKGRNYFFKQNIHNGEVP